VVRKLVRVALALLVPVLVVPTLLAGVVAVRVCTEPLDVTSVRQRVEQRVERLRGAAAASTVSHPGSARAEASLLSVSLPHGETLEEFVEDVLRSDVARYWFHAILGRSLEEARCNPAASGLQWFKAAAHARTERQLARTVSGITRDLARSRPPDDTRAVLCEWARAGMAPAQTQAIARAGLRC
jgi:hypothetical protein